MNLESHDINDGRGNNQDALLAECLTSMNLLYAASGPPDDTAEMIKGMRGRLPALTLEMFDAYVEKLGGIQSPEHHLQMLEPVLQLHYLDWALLTDAKEPIYARAYGESIFNREVRKMAGEDMTPEKFERMGVIFFDGNGIKSLHKFMMYDDVSTYLKTCAQLFTDPNGPTREWLNGQGASFIPMAVGGDEIVLLVYSEHSVKDILPEIMEKFQTEIASSQKLSEVVNFDSKKLLRKFRFPEGTAQSTMSADEEEQALHQFRVQTFPKKWEASFSAGFIDLSEALKLFVGKRSVAEVFEGYNFDEIRAALFHLMMGVAEVRQAENKSAFKAALHQTNPLMANLLERNFTDEKDQLIVELQGEIRKLQNEKKRDAAIITELRRQLSSQVYVIMSM